MQPTPIEISELVLVHSIRLLVPNCDHVDRQGSSWHDCLGITATTKSILDVLPFAAAPWIRISAHNHIPAFSIDQLARLGSPAFSAIDAYLTLTGTRANAHRWRVSHMAIDNASANGHTHTLTLLLSHFGPSPLPYSTLAIDLASANGHTHVLDWWLASPIRPLKYTHHALTDASIHGHLNVMRWWKLSGLVYLYDVFRVLRSASRHGKLDVLQWYRDFLQGNMYCPPGVMEEAAARGDVAVLHWWTHKAGVPLLYKHAMDAATKHGHIHVLQWFVESGPRPLLFSVSVVEGAVDKRVQLWWKQSGLLESVSSAVEE
ncbi:hypothetical protein BCR44DRAFT_49618 [Catenaria anguillulae PL171]|uniref:Ankyrin repeat-containing domain protein n=1 Tax=Catenaria anguillulae PL171 TaxID=765915 RepID=A0A1Y2HT11_9FUNG|nr:hypothetical protein BCR44DRAFT_49618 [Catenaria anguillulae PL171]